MTAALSARRSFACLSLDGAGVAARCRLGEAERGHLLSHSQLREVLGLLLRTAEQQDTLREKVRSVQVLGLLFRTTEQQDTLPRCRRAGGDGETT